MAAFAASALGSLASALGIGGGTAAAGTAAAGSAAATGAAAAGTAAATAGTAAATSSIGWGSLLTGILSGGASLVSAMATMRQGQAQADDFLAKSADAGIDAKSEEINAMTRQTGLKQELLKNLGERDVAYAASGIDLSFGTPVTARREAELDAARAVGDDSETTNMRVARLRERSASFRLMAGEASRAARTRAQGTMLEAGLAAARRG